MKRMVPGYEEQFFNSPKNTGDYVSDCRDDFKKCMRDVFAEISEKVFNDEEDVSERIMKKALECYRSYFQSMKGGINLRDKEVKEGVLREEERQRNLYKALKELVKRFAELDVQLKIIKDGQYYALNPLMWNTGIVHGKCLQVNERGYLYALPLVPIITHEYTHIRGAPPAADIIYVDKNCVIMHPCGEEIDKSFWEASKRIFGGEKDLKKDFPGAFSARKKNNFIRIDSKESFSEKILNEIMEKYNVVAVLHGNIYNSTAYLYLKTRDKLAEYFVKSDWL